MGGDVSRFQTHVFNASPSDIWVKADHDKAYITGVSMSGSAGDAAFNLAFDQEWHKVNPGFVRIQPGYITRFDVHADLVYVSVRLGQKVIADNLEINGDHSVVITPEGNIERVKYGSKTEALDGSKYARYYKGGP